jgi:hypothetical protein
MSLFVFDRGEAISMDLSEFRWKNRLLFLFAPDSSHPLLKNLQTEIVSQKPEVEERDLVIFEILERGSSRMDAKILDHETADAIRKHFGVSEDEFTLILVGKDGGTKLRRQDPTGLKSIFDLIDSMPMRQNEMRRKIPPS